VFRHEVGGDAADILREGVDTGQDQRDAGSGPRRRDVDALYSRVGMGRQHRDGIALPRQLDVVDIRAPPRQEAPIFNPSNSLTDAERYHRRLLVTLSSRA
jgi:hypothetical protein